MTAFWAIGIGIACLMLAGLGAWLCVQAWTAGGRLAALSPWPERVRALAAAYEAPLETESEEADE